MRTVTQFSAMKDAHETALTNTQVILHNHSVKHFITRSGLLSINRKKYYVSSVTLRNRFTGNHAFTIDELMHIHSSVGDNGGVILYSYVENTIIIIDSVKKFIEDVYASTSTTRVADRDVYLLNFEMMRCKYKSLK